MRVGLRRLFERQTRGEKSFPLVVLTSLYFFDEFDTAAFGVLAPDIKEYFGLSDSEFVGLVAANLLVLALFTIPLGHIADRMNRTRMVVVFGVLAGTASLATGFAPGVGFLLAARLGNGVGALVNGTVHKSLLADYYSPDARATVFATHQNGVNLGALVAPLIAGATAAVFGWRVAFVVFFVPIVILALVAMRLVEPARGESDHAAVGVDPDHGIRHAVKVLWRVSSLRRVYYTAMLVGAGFLPLAAFLPLFYEREFGLESFARGAVGSAQAAFTVVGVVIGAKMMPKWTERGLGVPMNMVGRIIVLVAIALAGMALAPWLALSLLLGFVGHVLIGCFFAPVAVVLTEVAPAAHRSLAFSLLSLAPVVGIIGFFATRLASISDHFGIRWGLAVVAPFWILAGLVARTAAPFVADDTAAALGASPVDPTQELGAPPVVTSGETVES